MIECAKAMHAEATGGNDFWDSHSEAYQNSMIDRARACILKWLEQAPSAAMINEGFLAIANKAPCIVATATGTTPDAAYTAMCAQAKKELET